MQFKFYNLQSDTNSRGENDEMFYTFNKLLKSVLV